MAKLVFTGDIVMCSPQANTISPELKKIIKDSDLASCNLEAPVSSGLNPIKKIGPSVYQNKDSVTYLKEVGFSFFSLANNHVMDYGTPSLSETLSALSETLNSGAGFSNTEATKLVIKNIDGVNFGFLCFAEWGFGAIDDIQLEGFAWIHHPDTPKIIRDARDSVDILIVQVHAGVENILVPLPEWRTSYKELINYGADIVIGHHSHTVQGHEEINGGHIFYSLGNFYFDKESDSKEWNKGALLSLEFLNKNLTSWQVIPTIIENKVVKINIEPGAENIISERTSLLLNDYEKYINTLTLSLWESHYKHFFTKSLGGYFTVRGLIRSLLTYIFGKSTIDYTLLSHNLNIESHRFVVERACKLLTK